VQNAEYAERSAVSLFFLRSAFKKKGGKKAQRIWQVVIFGLSSVPRRDYGAMREDPLSRV
jgi:hypothetical protein